jgi:hypothetical protein
MKGKYKKVYKKLRLYNKQFKQYPYKLHNQ